MFPLAALRAAARTLVPLALAAPVALAQGPRTVEFSRQLRDSLPLAIRVDYNAGKVVVHGTEQPLLYQMQLSYDPRRSQAVYGWDAESRVLRVGARRTGSDEAGAGGSAGAPELRLDVARSVPVDLALAMGAAEADLDLGGMRLRRVAVESGASDAVIHFDTPNLIPMERLDLDVGAASLRARGLANSRAREIGVKVGIGAAELDFGGEWAGDMELDLQIALGKATLRVPQDVGVRVDASRFLGSFEREGFVKRDDGYYSANWDSARRRLSVRSRMILGTMELTRGPA